MFLEPALQSLWQGRLVGLDRHHVIAALVVENLLAGFHLGMTPEHCGGIGGYASSIAAMANPTYKKHKALKELIDGKWKAALFSVEVVNQLLKTTGLDRLSAPERWP